MAEEEEEQDSLATHEVLSVRQQTTSEWPVPQQHPDCKQYVGKHCTAHCIFCEATHNKGQLHVHAALILFS